MTKSNQDVYSTNNNISQSFLSPPPPYTRRADDYQQEEDDSVSKMRKVIQDTYQMMQDFQSRLVSLECTNQVLISGLNQGSLQTMYVKFSSSFLLGVTHFSYNFFFFFRHPNPTSHFVFNHHDNDRLISMNSTVQNLLQEAQSSLNRTFTTISDKLEVNEHLTTPIIAMTLEQQSRYRTSQRNLETALDQLMNEVNTFTTTTTLPFPSFQPLISNNKITKPYLEQHNYHIYHHHHHHYYHPTPSSQTYMNDLYETTFSNEDDDNDNGLSHFSTTNEQLTHQGIIDTNNMFTSATSKSLQMVQSWLSPFQLLNTSSPTTRTTTLADNTHCTYLPTTTTLSSKQQQQNQSRHAPLYRVLLTLFVVGRLLLHQRCASILGRSTLDHHHSLLWRRYHLYIFGSLPTTPFTSTPLLRQYLLSLVYITQFLYHP
ncbi:uncharacterized protein BX664DRAFT_333736 [Halteromyces radiatus]|uniref:uncharacterized protein n=1 Tax=Halteromyces radiatus TaxID=101107 RepID=UPI00221FBD1F|nr:uncharacterized protein BX664DRAFT_333736 [Halteromyces radiatus]KAI8089726.1 hypothetical protein BX664DRAFT_333736 [Halteromyces radiatus]